LFTNTNAIEPPRLIPTVPQVNRTTFVPEPPIIAPSVPIVATEMNKEVRELR